MVVCRTMEPAQRCLEAFSQDFQGREYLQLLAHLWDVSGLSRLGIEEMHLEGLRQPYFSHQILTSLQAFIKDSSEAIPSKEAEILTEMFETGLRFPAASDAPAMLKRFRADKPLLIHTGFVGHAVDVVFYGDYLIVNNKGGETRNPIEVWKIDRDKVSEDVIEEIIQQFYRPQETYLDCLERIRSTLGGFRDPLAGLMMASYPMYPIQTIGNCSWESQETAVWSVLTLHRLVGKVAPNNPESIHVIESVSEIFEHWLQFTMVDALESYLKDHAADTPETEYPLDRALAMKVFQQAWRIPSWRQENLQRLDQIEGQFLAMLSENEQQQFLVEKVAGPSGVNFVQENVNMEAAKPTILHISPRQRLMNAIRYAPPEIVEALLEKEDFIGLVFRGEFGLAKRLLGLRFGWLLGSA